MSALIQKEENQDGVSCVWTHQECNQPKTYNLAPIPSMFSLTHAWQLGRPHSKNNFLPNTFVPTIENMEGSGGKLTINGYGSIKYRAQTDDRSKVTIKVNNHPYVPNLKFCILVPQQIATDEKNKELPKHERGPSDHTCFFISIAPWQANEKKNDNAQARNIDPSNRMQHWCLFFQ